MLHSGVLCIVAIVFGFEDLRDGTESVVVILMDFGGRGATCVEAQWRNL